MYATKNFAEMVLVLSLLDLPLNPKGENFEIQMENQSVGRLTSREPLIVFTRESQECQAPPQPAVLASQNYFDPEGFVFYQFISRSIFNKISKL